MDLIEKEAGLKAVVIRAASEKYFVVGANIEALRQLTPEGMEYWVRRGHRCFNRLANLPFPVIACVAGATMGGGLELAMACDYIVAGDGARFAQPEAALGFMMGWGGTYRLAKMIGPGLAKHMYYTGKVLTASEARDAGLVVEVVPVNELNKRMEEIVASIRKNAALGIRFTKETINAHLFDRAELAVLYEASSSVSCIHSPETKKRMEDFFTSRRKK
jgi:enoyl-CoA hydratase